MPDLPLSSPGDALHKARLLGTLSAIADEAMLAEVLSFKGGTCAALLGWLDRFSIDLDFDYLGTPEELPEIRAALERLFEELAFTIRDKSAQVPQYFLKYDAPQGVRNSLKIDISTHIIKHNRSEPTRFDAIDRVLTAHTQETMVANKLVALMERYEKREAIAGRDVYDIHYFLAHGFRYIPAIIEERTGKDAAQFFDELIAFVQKHITETIITEDLNTLLSPQQFTRARKTLKQETIALLREERIRMTSA